MTRALLLAAALVASAPVLAQEPTRSDGWVVLPVDEYRALRTKAYPLDPEPSPPPVDAALTRIDYDLKVVAETATGEARVSVDVFKEGWVKVAIPDGLFVREARLDGRPVSLVEGAPGKGGSAPYVLLSKLGRATLSLEVAVPVSSTAGTETVTLPASSAALSRASLSLPRQGIDLQLTGGFLAEKTEAGEGVRFLAHGRPGEPLAFSWRRKREERRVTQPLRFRGSVTEIVGLSEDAAQVNATVRLEVIQGAAASASVALPEGFVVNEVSGAAVGDWEQKGGSIVVKLLEPAEREAAFVLTGESRAPRDGVVSVPLLRLPAAERETGGVAVEVLGAGEIKEAQAKGLDAADPADLGDPVAGRDSPSLVAYRFRPQEGKAPRSLAVAVSRYTPQAVLVAAVEEARFEALLTEEGKRLVRARYAVRNNAKNFLGLTLPEGAALWSASVAGRPARPGRSSDGVLLLPLTKSRVGEEAPAFSVEVVYFEKGAAWPDKGRGRLGLPAADLPANRTGLELYHSPRYKLTAQPGAFRVQPLEPPASTAFRDYVSYADQRAPLSGQAAAKPREEDKAGADLQALVDRFQKAGRASRVSGTLPVQVAVPPVGRSLFLVSELTAEGQAPAIEFEYTRVGK
jgi:hypothetical protein